MQFVAPQARSCKLQAARGIEKCVSFSDTDI
jgi:hypothetical protein